jgi:regulator of sigma E protease
LNLVMLGIFLFPGIICFTLAHISGVPEPITGSNLKGEEAPIAKTVITEVDEEAPAAQKGIQVDDIILGADDVEFKYIGDMVTYIERTKGTEVTLHLDRKGQKIDIPIVPRANPPENQGALGVSISYQGVENEIVHYALPIALVKGVKTTVDYIGLALYLPIALFRETLPKEATQPVDPAEFNRQLASAASGAITANQWFQIFWLLGALYTANLIPLALVTIISLLPIPGWDSWRILALIFGK